MSKRVGGERVDLVERQTPTWGLLGDRDARPFRLRRYEPSDDLAWCVEHHWVVTWDLTGQPDEESQVLPNPSVNISYTDGRLNVTGVMSRVFTHPLSGAGWVYGVKFHPGGVRPFVPFDVRRLTDKSQPATDVWPQARRLRDFLRRAAPPRDDSAVSNLVGAGEAFLRSFRVTEDPVVETVRELTFRLLRDPTVRRVVDVCDSSLEQRTLQRMFRSYVGVPPRWVLQRGRLHLAAERVAERVAERAANRARPRSDVDRPGWAEIAVDLGYADQAHFIRDFRRVIGETPAAYVERLTPDGAGRS